MNLSRILALLASASLGLLLSVSLVPWSRVLLPRLPAPMKIPESPVVVSIEDLAGESWPWPRLDLTLALRAISLYRPDPVGLLLPLDAPDTLEPVQDDQLARAFAAFSPPALPATTFPSFAETEKISFLKIPHRGSIENLRPAESFLAPEESLRKSSTLAAWKVTPEANGELHRLPLVFRQEHEVIPSWLLVMYAQALGADLTHSELQGRQLILRDRQDLPLQTIPLDLRGSVPIDWGHPDILPSKMEIRGVVLAAEQERIGVKPYYDLKSISKKPVIVAGGLAEVDPIIDSPIGKRSLAEAVVRAWSGLSNGPQPVLHPPSWVMLGTLLIASALGLSSGNRGRVCLFEGLALSGLVFGAGWIAAKMAGYSGAFPLSMGSFLATLLAPKLNHWMEARHVR